MLRLLDRYVIRAFVGSYALCLFFFLGLFIIVDFFARMEDFVRARETIVEAGYSMFGSISLYYLYSAPFIFQDLAPFITLMGAMFTVARLLKTNELYPMVHAGVSLYRVLAPILLFALLLTGVMIASQEVLIPRLSLKRGELERMCSGLDPRVIDDLETITDRNGDKIRIASFDPELQRIHGLDVTRFREQEELRADVADYREGRWVLEHGVPRNFGDPTTPRPLVRVWDTDITPADIRLATEDKTYMSFSQLLETYRRNPERTQILTLMHHKLTFPVGNLVLVLLGFWAVLRRRAQSIFFGIALCLVICVLYFGVDFVAQALAQRGTLHPIVASWLPVTLFGSAGVALFQGIRT